MGLEGTGDIAISKNHDLQRVDQRSKPDKTMSDMVVKRSNFLNQFNTNAYAYQIVTTPESGVDVFDMDTRTFICQGNRSGMLHCLFWLAFCWGTYSFFEISGAPERSQISLKQAAHSRGLSYDSNQVQNIRLEANRIWVQSRMVDGRQVLHVEATVVFANNQWETPSVYILYLDIDAAVKGDLMWGMRG